MTNVNPKRTMENGRMKTNDGGPAFPSQDGNELASTHSPGMTLRDWFAGQASLGELSLPEGVPIGTERLYAERAAYLAYMQADAMLAEREKPHDD